MGEEDLLGLVTADSILVNRTHADVDDPPTVDPTAPTDPGRGTFFLHLPDPDDIDTGPVMYASPTHIHTYL